MVISLRKSLDRALVWFRRDLRTADRAALARALREAESVRCVFVLDKAIRGQGKRLPAGRGSRQG